MVSATPAPRLGLRPALILDMAERLTLLVLFTRLLINNYHAVITTGHWFNWLMVLSEALGLLFVMIRKTAEEVSDNPSDWTMAFFATAGPLLVHPVGPSPLAPVWIGVCLMVFGVAAQLSAKICLNRSFGIVPANRGVKRSGPYRFVRHPMYLGYVCVHIGFLLTSPSAWNLSIYALSFLCQIVRLLAEERLLSRDPAYEELKAAVPYRLLPGVF